MALSTQFLFPLVFHAGGTITASTAASESTPGNLWGIPIGNEVFRWVVPSLPQSKGVIVRGCKAKAQDSTGSPSVTIRLQKGTTNLLTGTTTITGTAARSFTVTSDGSAICNPGDVLTIDIAPGTQTTTSSLTNISFQVDLDLR